MKIYYGKKAIILKESFDTSSKDKLKKNTYIFNDNKQLIKIFDAFFENNDIEEITILHKDSEFLKKNIKLHFKFIEAAGGVVFNDKNEVLIIQRFGIPDLPKGKAEKGESPEDTALREVEEECGISELAIIKEIESTYHIYIRNNKRILKRTYWYEMKYSGKEKPVPQIEEEIEYAKFISKDNIPELSAKTYHSLRKIFEHIIE